LSPNPNESFLHKAPLIFENLEILKENHPCQILKNCQLMFNRTSGSHFICKQLISPCDFRSQSNPQNFKIFQNLNISANPKARRTRYLIDPISFVIETKKNFCSNFEILKVYWEHEEDSLKKDIIQRVNPTKLLLHSE
jgi:hypothetical protein